MSEFSAILDVLSRVVSAVFEGTLDLVCTTFLLISAIAIWRWSAMCNAYERVNDKGDYRSFCIQSFCITLADFILIPLSVVILLSPVHWRSLSLALKKTPPIVDAEEMNFDLRSDIFWICYRAYFELVLYCIGILALTSPYGRQVTLFRYCRALASEAAHKSFDDYMEHTESLGFYFAISGMASIVEWIEILLAVPLILLAPSVWHSTYQGFVTFQNPSSKPTVAPTSDNYNEVWQQDWYSKIMIHIFIQAIHALLDILVTPSFLIVCLSPLRNPLLRRKYQEVTSARAREQQQHQQQPPQQQPGRQARRVINSDSTTSWNMDDLGDIEHQYSFALRRECVVLSLLAIFDIFFLPLLLLLWMTRYRYNAIKSILWPTPIDATGNSNITSISNPPESDKVRQPQNQESQYKSQNETFHAIAAVDETSTMMTNPVMAVTAVDVEVDDKSNNNNDNNDNDNGPIGLRAPNAAANMECEEDHLPSVAPAAEQPPPTIHTALWGVEELVVVVKQVCLLCCDIVMLLIPLPLLLATRVRWQPVMRMLHKDDVFLSYTCELYAVVCQQLLLLLLDCLVLPFVLLVLLSGYRTKAVWYLLFPISSPTTSSSSSPSTHASSTPVTYGEEGTTTTTTTTTTTGGAGVTTRTTGASPIDTALMADSSSTPGAPALERIRQDVLLYHWVVLLNCATIFHDVLVLAPLVLLFPCGVACYRIPAVLRIICRQKTSTGTTTNSALNNHSNSSSNNNNNSNNNHSNNYHSNNNNNNNDNNDNNNNNNNNNNRTRPSWGRRKLLWFEVGQSLLDVPYMLICCVLVFTLWRTGEVLALLRCRHMQNVYNRNVQEHHVRQEEEEQQTQPHSQQPQANPTLSTTSDAIDTNLATTRTTATSTGNSRRRFSELHAINLRGSLLDQLLLWGRDACMLILLFLITVTVYRLPHLLLSMSMKLWQSGGCWLTDCCCFICGLACRNNRGLQDEEGRASSGKALRNAPSLLSVESCHVAFPERGGPSLNFTIERDSKKPSDIVGGSYKLDPEGVVYLHVYSPGRLPSVHVAAAVGSEPRVMNHLNDGNRYDLPHSSSSNRNNDREEGEDEDGREEQEEAFDEYLWSNAGEIVGGLLTSMVRGYLPLPLDDGVAIGWKEYVQNHNATQESLVLDKANTANNDKSGDGGLAVESNSNIDNNNSLWLRLDFGAVKRTTILKKLARMDQSIIITMQLETEMLLPVNEMKTDKRRRRVVLLKISPCVRDLIHLLEGRELVPADNISKASTTTTTTTSSNHPIPRGSSSQPTSSTVPTIVNPALAGVGFLPQQVLNLPRFLHSHRPTPPGSNRAAITTTRYGNSVDTSSTIYGSLTTNAQQEREEQNLHVARLMQLRKQMKPLMPKNRSRNFVNSFHLLVLESFAELAVDFATLFMIVVAFMLSPFRTCGLIVAILEHPSKLKRRISQKVLRAVGHLDEHIQSYRRDVAPVVNGHLKAKLPEHLRNINHNNNDRAIANRRYRESDWYRRHSSNVNYLFHEAQNAVKVHEKYHLGPYRTLWKRTTKSLTSFPGCEGMAKLLERHGDLQNRIVFLWYMRVVADLAYRERIYAELLWEAQDEGNITSSGGSSGRSDANTGAGYFGRTDRSHQRHEIVRFVLTSEHDRMAKLLQQNVADMQVCVDEMVQHENAQHRQEDVPNPNPSTAAAATHLTPPPPPPLSSSTSSSSSSSPPPPRPTTTSTRGRLSWKHFRKSCGLFARPLDETRRLIYVGFLQALGDFGALCLLLFMCFTIVRLVPLCRDCYTHNSWSPRRYTTRLLLHRHLRLLAADVMDIGLFCFYTLLVVITVGGIPHFLAALPSNMYSYHAAAECAKAHAKRFFKNLCSLLSLMAAFRTYRILLKSAVYCAIIPGACLAEANPFVQWGAEVRFAVGFVIWLGALLGAILVTLHAQAIDQDSSSGGGGGGGGGSGASEDASTSRQDLLYYSACVALVLVGSALCVGRRAVYRRPDGRSTACAPSLAWSHILALLTGPIESLQLSAVVLYFFWHNIRSGYEDSGREAWVQGGDFLSTSLMFWDNNSSSSEHADHADEYSVSVSIAVCLVAITSILIAVPLATSHSSSSSSSGSYNNYNNYNHRDAIQEDTRRRGKVLAFRNSDAYELSMVVLTRLLCVWIMATLLRGTSCMVNDATTVDDDDPRHLIALSTARGVECGGGDIWASAASLSLLTYYLLTTSILHADETDLLRYYNAVDRTTTRMSSQNLFAQSGESVKFAPLYALSVRTVQFLVCAACFGGFYAESSLSVLIPLLVACFIGATLPAIIAYISSSSSTSTSTSSSSITNTALLTASDGGRDTGGSGGTGGTGTGGEGGVHTGSNPPSGNNSTSTTSRSSSSCEGGGVCSVVGVTALRSAGWVCVMWTVIVCILRETESSTSSNWTSRSTSVWVGWLLIYSVAVLYACYEDTLTRRRWRALLQETGLRESIEKLRAVLVTALIESSSSSSVPAPSPPPPASTTTTSWRSNGTGNLTGDRKHFKEWWFREYERQIECARSPRQLAKILLAIEQNVVMDRLTNEFILNSSDWRRGLERLLMLDDIEESGSEVSEIDGAIHRNNAGNRTTTGLVRSRSYDSIENPPVAGAATAGAATADTFTTANTTTSNISSSTPSATRPVNMHMHPTFQRLMVHIHQLHSAIVPNPAASHISKPLFTLLLTRWGLPADICWLIFEYLASARQIRRILLFDDQNPHSPSRLQHPPPASAAVSAAAAASAVGWSLPPGNLQGLLQREKHPTAILLREANYHIRDRQLRIAQASISYANETAASLNPQSET